MHGQHRCLAGFLTLNADRLDDVPLLDAINPPLWEVAHVAWFDEWFCLRGGGRGDRVSAHRPLWPEADAWLDSSRIPHAARWRLPELTRARVTAHLTAVGEATAQALACVAYDDAALEPFRLALLHQAMHLEALAWLAQRLGWPAPAWVREHEASAPLDCASATVRVPAHAAFDPDDGRGFVFDNEIGARWTVASPARLTPLVRMDDFARWVEAGGHARATGHEAPRYWRRAGSGGWEHRRFDRWLPCTGADPVVHVSAAAAEAYCRDHGGRLPTEDELSLALAGLADGPLSDAGVVWEWTSSVFSPYDGFAPGLYRDYSLPSFDGRHRVLKGGSFAAPVLLHHPRFRNFFLPTRDDVFAGFRMARPA
jgi:iron(II)-dependent oxidoreductase